MQSANGSAVNDYRSLYQGLHHTGIDYYLKKDRQGLQSHRPVVCAACLIVLENDPHYLTKAQHTILDGMLKVLDLAKDDYCVAWMTHDRAGTKIGNLGTRAGLDPGPYRKSSVLKYAPYSVLFLGSAFEKIKTDDIPIAYTYSPAELEIDPKRKRSAFDTLLDLKKHLVLLGSPVGAGLCAGPVSPSPGD